MKLLRDLFFILIAFVISPLVMAESIVVIINEENSQSLTADEIKGIYTDNIIQWKDGSSIKSYDLPTKNDAREAFSQKVLGVSAQDAARDWANRKITNTAKNPPKTQKEKLVVLAVKKEKEAIGYVSKSEVEGQSGIKVVMTID